MHTRLTLFAALSLALHALLLLPARIPPSPALGGTEPILAVRVNHAMPVEAAPDAQRPARPVPKDTPPKTQTRRPPPLPSSPQGREPRNTTPLARIRPAPPAPVAASATRPGPAATTPGSASPRTARHDDRPIPDTTAVERRISAALRKRLAHYFEYPWLARQRGWEGQVMLSLRVLGNGRLDDWRIEHSSGHRTLDQSALKAARRIRQLPLAAQWLGGRSLRVRIPVRYRLLDS